MITQFNSTIINSYGDFDRITSYYKLSYNIR
jgi:hypothetical protein